MKRIRRATKKIRGREREERSRRRGWREEMYRRKGKIWKGRIFPDIKLDSDSNFYWQKTYPEEL